jgi:hypothetical protein
VRRLPLLLRSRQNLRCRIRRSKVRRAVPKKKQNDPDLTIRVVVSRQIVKTPVALMTTGRKSV